MSTTQLPPVYVSGQGGNITLTKEDGRSITLYLRNWMLRKDFINDDTTTTGCGGWGQETRVLARWSFIAEMPFDVANPPDVVTSAAAQPTVAASGATNILNIMAGIDSAKPVAVSLQLGASNLFYRGTTLMRQDGIMVDAAQKVVGFMLVGGGNGPLFGPSQA